MLFFGSPDFHLGASLLAHADQGSTATWVSGFNDAKVQARPRTPLCSDWGDGHVKYSFNMLLLYMNYYEGCCRYKYRFSVFR